MEKRFNKFIQKFLGDGQFHMKKSYFPLQSQSMVDQSQCLPYTYISIKLPTSWGKVWLHVWYKTVETKNVCFADTLDNFKECESHSTGTLIALL